MYVPRLRKLPILTLIPAILVIASSCGGAGDEASPPKPGEYGDATVAAFEKLLSSPEWVPAEPPRNPRQMLQAIHVKTGLTFVLLEAGSFQMGSPESEEGRQRNEVLHSVTFKKPFLLCETTCTNAAWNRGEESPAEDGDGADEPKVSVNWTECRGWCERNGLRLPSESEWEYACRAGTQTTFSFGDDGADLDGSGWYFINSGDEHLPKDTKHEKWDAWNNWGCKPHAVRQKEPNAWGFYDMHGNVWEWCTDTYGPYSEAPTDGSPRTKKGGGNVRMLMFRGGCYAEEPEDCRSANRRFGAQASFKGPHIGFRPAADLPE